MTTRPKRAGEIDGKDYFFLTKSQFEEKIREHALLEYATFAGNYYGTPKEFVDKLRAEGKNVCLEIEPQGGLQIIKMCEQNKDKGERDKEKELRLMYAQMIQGLKLNTLFNNRNFYFWIKNKQ